MIRFVEKAAEQDKFFEFCRGSAFGCKLAATAGAYGFVRDFARFWLGEGAAYCLLDGVLSVAGTPADLEEARIFAGSVGAQTVFCPRSLAGEWGLAVRAEGKVLAKVLPPGEPEEAVQPPPGVLEIWELLAAAGMELDREAFYLDLSHRLRHGAALATGARDAMGTLAGCAVAVLAGGEAMLSALAVRADCRRQGMGSRLVTGMERRLPGKRLYVLREAGENAAFYKNLGYEVIDAWCTGGFNP